MKKGAGSFERVIFSRERMSKFIDKKGMFALFLPLRQFVEGSLKTCVVNNLGSTSTTNPCWGRSNAAARVTVRSTRCWCRSLTCRSSTSFFMIVLKRVPTAIDGVADAVSRPSWD